MTEYIARIHKEPESDFGDSFPDFPGCITAGSTLEEARRMAEEALAFHIEGMTEDGETIPAPSDLDAIMADPEMFQQIMVNLVVRANRPAKTVRINVTMPDILLEEIDRSAKARGLNRSEFLAEGARRLMSAA